MPNFMALHAYGTVIIVYCEDGLNYVDAYVMSILIFIISMLYLFNTFCSGMHNETRIVIGHL